MISVLFVSQDPDLRAAAKRALERGGCKVTTAAHGGHATLALAGDGVIDVLVIENDLPEGRGKAVAGRLRRYRPDLAVVVMCDRRSFVPADEFAVVRPFTADDLIDAIVNAVVASQTLRGATSL